MLFSDAKFSAKCGAKASGSNNTRKPKKSNKREMNKGFAMIENKKRKTSGIIASFRFNNNSDDGAGAPGTGPGIAPGTGTAPAPVLEEEAAAKTKKGEGWAVILFNDDQHDMVEVTVAIMAATGFDQDTAWAIMERAHKDGKAIVVITDQPEAEKVASVLRSAKLTVELKIIG